MASVKERQQKASFPNSLAPTEARYRAANLAQGQPGSTPGARTRPVSPCGSCECGRQPQLPPLGAHPKIREGGGMMDSHKQQARTRRRMLCPPGHTAAQTSRSDPSISPQCSQDSWLTHVLAERAQGRTTALNCWSPHFAPRSTAVHGLVLEGAGAGIGISTEREPGGRRRQKGPGSGLPSTLRSHI